MVTGFAVSPLTGGKYKRNGNYYFERKPDVLENKATKVVAFLKVQA